MTKKDLELSMYKIKAFDTKKLAKALRLSLVQTRNIKRGSSGISNTNALFLKKEFDLEPEGFAEIRKEFLAKKAESTL